MTKQFFHGRTEAIRQVTPESMNFVRTFWAEKPIQAKVDALKKACEKHSALTKECSKAQGHDRHLYALMSLWQREQAQEASAQTSLTRDDGSVSTNGFSNPPSEKDPSSVVSSPNRNSLVSEDGSIPPGGQSQSPPRKGQHTVPAIFDDSGWEMLNNTILSTSNCGNPSLRHFGFGPTSGDGFGIGYIIKDSSVSICASSKHRQTKRYIDALEAYFIEIRKLLRQTHRRGTSTDKQASRAREAEEHRPKGQRLKSRGRVIGGDVTTGKTPAEVDSASASDDDLGGCKLTKRVKMILLLTCCFRRVLRCRYA
jgi:carnitine O-acetyltransferase